MLRCNGKNIQRVYSFKYLGIDLYSNYCFDVHFDSVLSHVSHALGKIGKLRRFMTKRVFVISLESFLIPLWTMVLLFGVRARLKACLKFKVESLTHLLFSFIQNYGNSTQRVHGKILLKH
jgi:hypothetical protein